MLAGADDSFIFAPAFAGVKKRLQETQIEAVRLLGS
jgi:hypothetical protein